MLERFNNYYSAVVERLRLHRIEVTHDYANKPWAIPLPATVTHELAKESEQCEVGMQVRLYSEYPFPWRKKVGGPKDDFEWDALRRLQQDPTTPVYMFTELDGRPVVRYAMARLMKASCIQCHNGHPNTPKRDWKEGDVRGILEIIRPLDQDAARTRHALQETFVLVGVISLLLLGLSVLVLVGSRRSRLAAPDRPPL
jgi:adenylate cyclase